MTKIRNLGYFITKKGNAMWMKDCKFAMCNRSDMKAIYLNSIQQVNDLYGVTTLHPLVSVVHLNRRIEQPDAMRYHYGVYAVWLKETKGCTISYGRTPYDFDEMTVTSFAPGQTVDVRRTDSTIMPKCVGLFFHPDFLRRTNLGKNIARYAFFSYSSTEALHLSESEVAVFRQVVNMLEQELHHQIDTHTRDLMVSNIELLLNYCLRFYDRQFITREEINHSVVKKFENMLNHYLDTQAADDGVPTVEYFAEKCCFSPGYFGEMVKTETGRTAQDFIADHILARAKQWLNDESLSIAIVSERLGFEYPQHFNRFFKRHTGLTPTQYRKAI